MGDQVIAFSSGNAVQLSGQTQQLHGMAWHGKFRMIGSAQIHNATIMYDGFIEQHLVLDIIFPAILLISAQMFIFRVATSAVRRTIGNN